MTLTSRHFLHGGLVTESYNMGSGQRVQERYRPRAEGLMRTETHAVWELGTDHVGSTFSHREPGLHQAVTALSGYVRTTWNVFCSES